MARGEHSAGPAPYRQSAPGDDRWRLLPAEYAAVIERRDTSLNIAKLLMQWPRER
jgi:hypothetical protein